MQESTPRGHYSNSRRQIGVGGISISESAKDLVRQVLDSGRLTAGPMMAEFEADAARLHGCEYGLMCNSGTSALHISLAGLAEIHGWQTGDEIIVPAVTFVATSNVVIHNGFKPVFVDVDPITYTMDPAALEQAITSKTRGVIPVHVGGMPCDMQPIMQVCRARGLAVIEDCAESMFATYQGAPVGSFGNVAAFSTYAAHIVTTGVGGLCTTNDAKLFDVLRSLMNHGRDSIYTRIDDDDLANDRDLFEVVDRRFSFVRLGHSFRATEMEAALGLAQLHDHSKLIADRRRIAARYSELLSCLEPRLQLPADRPGSASVHMFYAMVINDPLVAREDLVMHLESRGIETRYLLPLINQPIYVELFGNQEERCPVAARLNENAFYVGCHPEMSDQDADFVACSILEFFESR